MIKNYNQYIKEEWKIWDDEPEEEKTLIQREKELRDKLEVIREKKRKYITHQHYVEAAQMRDKERDILKELGEL